MKVTGLQMLAGTLASGSFSDWLSRNRSFVIWLQRIAGNTIVTLGAKSLLYVGAQLLRQCLVPGCNPALPHGGTLDDPQGAALPRAPPPMPWQIVPGLAVEGGEYNLKIQAVRPVKAATVPLCVPWQGKVNLGLVLQRKRQSHCRRRNGFNRSPTTAVTRDLSMPLQPNFTRLRAGKGPPGNWTRFPPIEIGPRSMPKKPSRSSSAPTCALDWALSPE